MSFAGRVGLVAGAGSGIGRATARLLAERGGAVVAVDVNGPAASETADEIRRAGGRAAALPGDVTRAEDVDVALARQRFGRLDVLINCAGILRIAPLEATAEKEWAEVLAVNLTGAFLLTRAALAAMREQGGGGAIVHIASRAALRAKEGHAAYAASKAGILQLTQTAALEGARHGIRVNCVCPGFIDTPMTRGGYEPEAFPAWEEVCPLGRAGQPEDVARAMLFLASDEAAFITGVALPVDGGRTIL
jgi:NAD(P)-dependent dehydrogenase (short-subunit alcohol dehydrogenase family)